MSETINIAFGFDDRYAPHAAVTAASIAAHTRANPLHFYIVHDGVPDPRRSAVEAAAPRARFTWLEIEADALPHYAKRAETSYINHATLFRLSLERLAPATLTRVLYLDIDLVAAADLAPLWSARLGEAPLGAAPDPYVDAAAFAAQYGLKRGPHPYFNAGVLVMDLERMRREDFSARAIKFLVEHNPHYADQDALNATSWGRVAPLALRWNVQAPMVINALSEPPSADIAAALAAPGIVHFTGAGKPWLSGAYHPWAWLYWRHLAATRFEREVARTYAVTRAERLRIWLRYMRLRRRFATPTR